MWREEKRGRNGGTGIEKGRAREKGRDGKSMERR